MEWKIWGKPEVTEFFLVEKDNISQSSNILCKSQYSCMEYSIYCKPNLKGAYFVCVSHYVREKIYLYVKVYVAAAEIFILIKQRF